MQRRNFRSSVKLSIVHPQDCQERPFDNPADETTLSRLRRRNNVLDDLIIDEETLYFN